MPDTEIIVLEKRLHGCHDCAVVFRENVTPIEGDNGGLTAEQTRALLVYLNVLHESHVH